MKKVYTHLKKIKFKYLLLSCLLFGNILTKAQSNFSSISFSQPLNFVSIKEVGASFLAKGDFNDDSKVDIVITNT